MIESWLEHLRQYKKASVTDRVSFSRQKKSSPRKTFHCL